MCKEVDAQRSIKNYTSEVAEKFGETKSEVLNVKGSIIEEDVNDMSAERKTMDKKYDFNFDD